MLSFDLPPLADLVIAQATHAESPLHGPAHWQRVAEVGWRLCQHVAQADPVVVMLFALLHDSQRLDDGPDPQHGPRAARFVRTLDLPVSDRQRRLLVQACRDHTTSGPVTDPTVGVCFDADRLTLWRVGIRPDPAYLSCAPARTDGWLTYGRALEAAGPLSWQQLHELYETGELPSGRPDPGELPVDAPSAREIAGLFDRDEELHPDLRPYVDVSGPIPMLHHPLTIQLFYTPQLNAACNRIYEQKTRAVRDAVDNGDWAHYLAMHEKPYRLDALLDVADDLTDDEYWPLVADVWTGSENISQQAADWMTVLTCDRPGRQRMMFDDEQHALDRMPNLLRVFRGFHCRHGQHGLSWTVSEEKARWFAQRLCPPGQKPQLASAQVAKRDVIAFFARRGEQEIVTLPETLRDLTVTPAVS